MIEPILTGGSAGIIFALVKIIEKLTQRQSSTNLEERLASLESDMNGLKSQAWKIADKVDDLRDEVSRLIGKLDK